MHLLMSTYAIHAACFGAVLVLIFFIFSLYKTMQYVPREKSVFPNIFIFFIFIPIVGFVFAWMMFPFGIPGGLKNTMAENISAVRDAKILKWIGLTWEIIVTLSTIITFILYGSPEKALASAIDETTLVIFILFVTIYWIRTVSFRRKYFEICASN